jgi:DNA polymerase I-like protein with 3'-5' exonuclease and polymerase domains
MGNTVTLDVETTIKNRGHPFTPENFMVSYSAKINNESSVFKHYIQPDFLTFLRETVAKATLIVGFNFKFDLHWMCRYGIRVRYDCSIWDVSIAEFVLTGQEAVMISLDDVLISYGIETKVDKVKEYWELGIDTPDIPYEILEEYNNGDVDKTYQAFLMQCDIANEKQKTLILLQGADLRTLQAAEFCGIKFDVDKCVALRQQYADELTNLKEALSTYIPNDLPAECTFNWDSGDQLSALIYGGTITYEWRTEEEAVYKSGDKKGTSYLKGTWHSHVQSFPKRFNPLERSAVKKCLVPDYNGPMYYQVDDPTLKQLKTNKNENKQLLVLLDEVAKKGQVLKMMETFLKHFTEFGWEDNLVHGQYNQNIARTGRLSSSKPNMQNAPAEIDALLISRYD